MGPILTAAEPTRGNTCSNNNYIVRPDLTQLDSTRLDSTKCRQFACQSWSCGRDRQKTGDFLSSWVELSLQSDVTVRLSSADQLSDHWPQQLMRCDQGLTTRSRLMQLSNRMIDRRRSSRPRRVFRSMSHLQFSRAILSREFFRATKLQVWHGESCEFLTVMQLYFRTELCSILCNSVDRMLNTDWCNFISRLCCTLARQNCVRKLQAWHRSIAVLVHDYHA